VTGESRKQSLLEQLLVLGDRRGRTLLTVLEIVEELGNGFLDGRDLRLDDADLTGGSQPRARSDAAFQDRKSRGRLS